MHQSIAIGAWPTRGSRGLRVTPASCVRRTWDVRTSERVRCRHAFAFWWPRSSIKRRGSYMALASSQLYFNHLQLKTSAASKRCEQCILPSWAEVLQSAFAICNCSRAIRIQLPLGRETAGCICNLELQPSHLRATYECSGPSCNCSRESAIAAEILQLQPRFCRPGRGGRAA